MKNTSEQLDIFLRNTLRANDDSVSPADWNEIEMLLRHNRKPIAANVRKKILFVSAGILVIVLVGFGIVKWVHYYASSSPETDLPVNEIEILTTSDRDSQEVISDTAARQTVIVADTSDTEIDSVMLIRIERRADSLITDFKNKQAEEKKLQAGIKSKEKAATIQDTQKAEKKNLKISSLAPAISDSNDVLDNILLPEDISRSIEKTEIKNDSPPTSDSSKVSPAKSKKSKKAKSGSTAGNTLGTDVSKPDSLK